MRFEYKTHEYELTELTEPNRMETFDIIAIFRVKYCIWKETNLIEVDKDTYEKITDNFEKYEFVDYFYGSDQEDDELIEQAKEIIKEKENNGSNC